MKGEKDMKQTRQSKPRVDLTGQQFDYLTPMYYIKGGKQHCKCECGNEIDVDTRNLNSHHTKSCGCKTKQLIGQKLTIDMSNYEDDNIKVLERNSSSEIGQAAKQKCICKHCGREFITEGKHIREGVVKSCGCIHSYNEKEITKLFIENNIEFAAQYTFPDLKGKDNVHPLKFDFAIFKNGQLQHLIEYNGLQHYEKVPGKQGEYYSTLIENDQKKIQYCKEHNIELRIIKYNQNYTLKDLI